ncbi:MAG: DUF1893 domain-containing protein [Candidatus Howiella sp.]
MTENLQKAKAILDEGDATCVILPAGGDAVCLSERGIAPLVHILRTSPELLRGAASADRVVGKAAAMLFAYGGVREVYAAVLSEPAAGFLDSCGILYGFEKRVPYIVNRAGDGMCPMETRALPLTDPHKAWRLFDEICR